jgi:hypothetical protein
METKHFLFTTDTIIHHIITIFSFHDITMLHPDSFLPLYIQQHWPDCPSTLAVSLAEIAILLFVPLTITSLKPISYVLSFALRIIFQYDESDESVFLVAQMFVVVFSFIIVVFLLVILMLPWKEPPEIPRRRRRRSRRNRRRSVLLLRWRLEYPSSYGPSAHRSLPYCRI